MVKKMESKFYRTCQVTKWGDEYAICELHYKTNKYNVVVLNDSEDLFVDFDLEIYNHELPQVVIKYFEDECINRFTCYGEFSIEQIKANSGEEISFY